MHIEYCIYDRSPSEKEIVKEIEQVLNKGIKNFCLFPYSVASLKNSGILKEINVCMPIDFPFGVMDLESRKSVIDNIMSTYKIQAIDIVAPSKALSNNKYSKLREDIDNMHEILSKYDPVDIRYVLEYRIFDHSVLARACQILKDKNIHTILPSTGNMIDDISDNIIACKYLESKSRIKAICTGNVYHDKHLALLKKHEIAQIRAFSLNSVNILMDY
jgi:deoxyribose-phosphate aldolase